MPPAAIIGVGAAVGGIGALASAKSQSKAANKAADTSMAVAAENNALARDIYGQNQQALSPYVQRGNAAGNALNSMLGLAQITPPQPQPGVQQFYSGGPNMGPGMSDYDRAVYSQPGYGLQGEMYNYMRTMDLPPEAANGYGAPPMPGPTGGYTGGTFNIDGSQATPGPGAGDPFRQYIANSDYAFQFGEGANKINSGYAGAGTLQSGAAMKDLEGYRQNLQQGYRGEYMNMLGNQQGVGLGAASAQAGVGQNYVNTISANNNNAGTAAANAALAKGANNPFGAFAGMVGGGLMSYGMGRI